MIIPIEELNLSLDVKMDEQIIINLNEIKESNYEYVTFLLFREFYEFSSITTKKF